MAERIIEILSRSDRPIILVFQHQGSLRKYEGVTPNGGDTPVTMLLWKTNIKSYVLYRMMPFSMTLSDPEPQFQGHSIV